MFDVHPSVGTEGSSADEMERLIGDIARSLVDQPSQVSIDAVPDGDGTILRLRVASGDVGKVIGRQGRTARSLRTILSAASMKLKRRYSLDISQESPDGAPES